MCGIAGHVAFPRADADVVAKMSAALRHRGPDGEGAYHEGAVAFGHRRLSIIDIASGQQPIFNEDGSIVVVFNGEIYNYLELRRQLEGRHRFCTASDTEVLVHLYEDRGEEMLDAVRGMFAFAIWDSRRQMLFAARDPFGEKPFYYTNGKHGFFFASELGALRQAPFDAGGIDRAALAYYLELLYVPAPATIWKHVRKLPAGTSLCVDSSGLRTRRYYSPPLPGGDSGATVDRASLMNLLKTAATIRLRSDVPVGVLLSGGLDSSTIVALVSSVLGAGVPTFSVGFGDDADELPFARMVADKFHTDHHELVLQRDVVRDVDEAFAAYSEPFGDTSSVPSVAIYRQIASQMKVVLTGDGGDELFAGYGRYRTLARLPHVPGLSATLPLVRVALPPARAARLERLVRVLGSRRGARVRALIDVFSPFQRAALLGECPSPTTIADLHTDTDCALAFDLGVYLPDDLLVKTDIASMHSSVEARCPILDIDVAAAVIPLPVSAKQTRRQGKLLLRQLARDLLPPALLRKPKSGFGSPISRWLRGPLHAMVHDLLHASNAHIRSWMDRRVIDDVVSRSLATRGNPYQAWALLALEAWAQRFARAPGG